MKPLQAKQDKMKKMHIFKSADTGAHGAIFLITAFAWLSVLSGCDNFNMEQFTGNDDIGLMVKGEYAIRYDAGDSQIGMNELRNEFWVTDRNMADYFILKCSSFPGESETVKADLTYTTVDNLIRKKNLTFEVTQYDQSSDKIHLWCQSERIGLIIKVLR